MNYFYERIVKKIYSVLLMLLNKRRSFFVKKNTLLIVKLDSIGDYVLFRNFIRVIKESDHYRNYKITLCGNIWWKELAEGLDKEFINDFIWVDYRRMTDSGYSYKQYREIHSRGFETLIHPTYSRDIISDNVVIYSGAKYKIGYDGDTINLSEVQKRENNLAYTSLMVSRSKHRFEFNRNKDFFEQLFSLQIPTLKPQIDYKTNKEEIIIICPGAKDAFRRWSAENFVRLCDLLQSKCPKADFVICGSEADSLIAKEIISKSQFHFSDLTGKLNLNELVAMLAKCKIAIVNDSGPFHIAVALGSKVVCISNGNNYGRFTPYPSEMNTESKVLYPIQITEMSEEERLENFGKVVEHVDINEIKAEQVFSEIEKMFDVK